LTREFRAFGTNVIVAPRETGSSSPMLLDESVAKQVRELHAPLQSSAVSNLYVIADVSSAASNLSSKVVIAGKRWEFPPRRSIIISRNGVPATQVAPEDVCTVGVKVTEQLQVRLGDSLRLQSSGREKVCVAMVALARGDEEDNQIFVPLETAQKLSALPG